MIVIAGLQAIRTLNVRQYPRSENAVITVTTVYVGASADLVRGFITTPLERVIAVGGRHRLPRVHQHPRALHHQRPAAAELRLHQGPGRDQLQGRPGAQRPAARGAGAGDQHRVRRQPVRLGLPQLLLRVPEAERDHRLPGAGGAAAAVRGRGGAAGRHPRRPHLRHAGLAQAGPDGGAERQPGPGPQALANNNYLSAVGQTKGSLVQVNLTANTDLRSVDEFKQLVIRQTGGAVVRLSDIADVVLGAEDYDTAVDFTGQTAVFVGIWALPNANSLDVIKRVPGGAGVDPQGAAGADQLHRRLRRHRVHPERHRRGGAHPARHAVDRGAWSSSSSSAPSARCWCRSWRSRCR